MCGCGRSSHRSAIEALSFVAPVRIGKDVDAEDAKGYEAAQMARFGTYWIC
jgi:hypothetical protein